MEKTEGRVDVEVESSVGWITLNNVTRHNAMSLSMWRGLGAAVDALQSDPEVRVVVLRGAGTKAFVSGADISEFESKRNSREANKEYDAAGHQAMSRLASLDKPTIAMLNGYCIGGG
ncbi:MAG TPA: enoyl-CoA hydratase/isomerase family protein, partial [Burkholderiaceae bacterium]|nr:enoyl-CoA hydratase/isomerase family protein [Burkholderiaceae bacterium]